MSKDAFYFPHDSNARHDPKILKMRTPYKMEGFGVYWATIEMMREQEGYLLPIDQESIDAYAQDFNIDSKLLKQFYDDCTKKYNLFQSDGIFLWSESLIRRMAKFDEKSFQAKEAANKRWGNIPPQSERNTDAMPTQSERIITENDQEKGSVLDTNNADAMPTQSERIITENDQEKGSVLDTNNADAMPTQSERNAIKSNKSISNKIIPNNNIPSFVDKDLWYDFLEMRKQKRVPNTDRAIKLLINKLTEFHSNKIDPNKSIEESIMRGWTGVFPLRGDIRNGNQQAKHQDVKIND